MRNVLITVTLLGALAAGCTDPGVPRDAGQGSEPTPSHTAGQAETQPLEAYEAVIRHLVSTEDADWETIYVMERICANAGDGAEVRGCNDAFALDSQDDLASRLSDLGASIRFVRDYEEADRNGRILEGRERSVFVWLGPVSLGPEGSVQVPGSMVCGGLCGRGSVWRLEDGEGAWVVAGSARGSEWIA
jgi:hypothetical protein